MALTNSWMILWVGSLLGSLLAAGLTVLLAQSYRSFRVAAVLAITLSTVLLGVACLLGGLLS